MRHHNIARYAAPAVANLPHMRDRLIKISAPPPIKISAPRRLHLIDKELAGTLAEVEKQELVELQASMAAELNAVAPLPFDRLDELERELNGRRRG